MSILYKMLKISIEFIVQVFHDNVSFSVVFFLIFGLVDFGLYYMGLLASNCIF